jgi:hypothetical protein
MSYPAIALGHLPQNVSLRQKAEERSFRLRSSEKLTLLNRGIRLADRETVCAI